MVRDVDAVPGAITDSNAAGDSGAAGAWAGRFVSRDENRNGFRRGPRR
jgi:hypothetical protein